MATNRKRFKRHNQSKGLTDISSFSPRRLERYLYRKVVDALYRCAQDPYESTKIIKEGVFSAKELDDINSLFAAGASEKYIAKYLVARRFHM